MSTPITLTRAGRVVGRAELFDSGAIFMWIVLEIAFPEARTITRNNDGWFVELESDRLVMSEVHDPKSFYPKHWPRCRSCGDYALDGKATCGRVDCL